MYEGNMLGIYLEEELFLSVRYCIGIVIVNRK
jgi:hypothetical protein